MRIDTLLLVSALSLGFVSAPALAQHAGHGPQTDTIRVEQPWVRATTPGAKVAGGFFALVNTGTAADKLTGGTADFADRVEVHEMAVVDNMMTMKRLDAGLEVAPGATVELKPGSYHIMFVGLKRQLTAGETVKVVLNFEKAGAVPVDCAVKTAPGQSGHKAH